MYFELQNSKPKVLILHSIPGLQLTFKLPTPVCTSKPEKWSFEHHNFPTINNQQKNIVATWGYLHVTSLPDDNTRIMYIYCNGYLNTISFPLIIINRIISVWLFLGRVGPWYHCLSRQAILVFIIIIITCCWLGRHRGFIAAWCRVAYVFVFVHDYYLLQSVVAMMFGLLFCCCWCRSLSSFVVVVVVVCVPACLDWKVRRFVVVYFDDTDDTT